MKDINVTIFVARPGVVIGKKGTGVKKIEQDVLRIIVRDMAKTDHEYKKLKQELAMRDKKDSTSKKKGKESPYREKVKDIRVSINTRKLDVPEMDASLVADNIAHQLERRVSFRRAVKRALQSAEKLGAQGIRIHVSGRIGGAEIARTEFFRQGQVPLHTLRADIDYGTAVAHTTYGTCGVKVWIYHGDIYEHDPTARDRRVIKSQQHRSRVPMGAGGASGRDSHEKGHVSTPAQKAAPPKEEAATAALATEGAQ
ncbi:MAG: 30S ribosomal protein S3 [Alphaproteobacteria bacterium GM7ARS4]|nr:30S ribosomal protein S3 [Alphaproteobacteria bacterium GM7ARS4]